MKIRISFSDILFEDNNYIAVHKKSGWPVHQTLDPNRPNLFSALKSFIKQRDKLDSEPYIALHHRLDAQTSGIVLFAKSKAANPVLASVFSDRKAVKIYQAICVGRPQVDEGVLEDFLKKEKVGRIEKMVPVKSGGEKTITKYRFLKSSNDLSLIEFELVTGRMHQIRVQSALRNFPILGDELYGQNNVNQQYKVDGQLLHASFFKFHDPIEDKEIVIHCNPEFSLENFSVKKSQSKTYILFNKPFNVLCQFTKSSEDEMALCDFDLPKDVYAAGRLDKDSEGLLLLTDDGDLINKIASPKFKKEKTYWVQVERIPSEESMKELQKGVTIKGGYKTLPCKARIIDMPNIWDRNPPIRERKNVPTSWLEITIVEGKNRQVRSMTAAIGHPTLRLVRAGIGKMRLGDLAIGQFKKVEASQLIF
ncbi:pseudouridylate synthase [Bacteriovorax sp. BSW11_IV]|uniref:pseudouridine synthase n=1 Tax=Bacteriovorax sp. BSW11_IV TaxID=1353529 RepID=UPI00038A33A2|nr:pseudouridine synthase [Bacteriovorax sp. BSW11_IV]EQC44999.1 pseudouridylate synthase [Bacteriovorax sp. BSW11_IV]